MSNSDRWRLIGPGALGYVWHDTVYNRYVISDEFGPVGRTVPGAGGPRGVRPATQHKQLSQPYQKRV